MPMQPLEIRPESILEISDGSYETAPGTRIPFLPTLKLYILAGSVIWKASNTAKAGGYSELRWLQDSTRIVRSLESAGCRFEVTGLENLQGLEKPCVFISNHMSTIETLSLPALLVPFMPVEYIVKEQLLNYPVFGHIMRAVQPITVTRKDPRKDLKDVMEKGREYVNHGTSVIVFPQTTRAYEFDPSKFNSLGIKLAKRSGAYAVPVALKTDAWGIGWPVKDLGRICPEKTVHITFGKPMEVEGTGREQHEDIVRFISSALDKWNEKPA